LALILVWAGSKHVRDVHFTCLCYDARDIQRLLSGGWGDEEKLQGALNPYYDQDLYLGFDEVITRIVPYRVVCLKGQAVPAPAQMVHNVAGIPRRQHFHNLLILNHSFDDTMIAWNQTSYVLYSLARDKSWIIFLVMLQQPPESNPFRVAEAESPHPALTSMCLPLPARN